MSFLKMVTTAMWKMGHVQNRKRKIYAKRKSRMIGKNKNEAAPP